MNVRPTSKVSKTSLVFKVEQTRGGSFGRIDDKDKNNNDDEGRGQKKTGSYGKNSQTGGGGESDPNPLLDVYIYHPKIVIFLVKTKNVPEVLK